MGQGFKKREFHVFTVFGTPNFFGTQSFLGDLPVHRMTQEGRVATSFLLAVCG